MPKGNCARCAAELARVSRQTTMGAMTASIAHEVNQPLAAIVMNARVENSGRRRHARATSVARAILH
jgi:C4-dicarboxylate-specific signal transduction histidine kinase